MGGESLVLFNRHTRARTHVKGAKKGKKIKMHMHTYIYRYIYIFNFILFSTILMNPFERHNKEYFLENFFSQSPE